MVLGCFFDNIRSWSRHLLCCISGHLWKHMPMAWAGRNWGWRSTQTLSKSKSQQHKNEADICVSGKYMQNHRKNLTSLPKMMLKNVKTIFT